MQRTSDWFSFPDSLGLVKSESGGVWVHKKQRYAHRSLLPMLPSHQREGVGAPLRAEVISDVEEQNLRPYQIDAARFSRERDGSILAMAMGTGKTRTSLYATKRQSPFCGLVVAPKVTFGVWQKEIALVYGPDFPVYVLRGRQGSGDPNDVRRPGIYIINPELLAFRWKEWLGMKLDFTIIDEAHLFTRGRAKRTRAAGNLANLSRQRIALTGTPILRHVMDLHGIVEAVAPGAFGSWGSMALWLGFRRGAHGWDLGAIEPAARDRLERRLAELMVSARWEDVASDVPPLQRELLSLDLDPDDRAEYEHLASDVRAVLGNIVGFEQLTSAAAAGLVQVSTLRKFVGEKKIEHVVDLVRAAGEPVVVWTWHRSTAYDTARRLRDGGLSVSVVTGEDKDQKRAEQIAKFQNAETDVFVGTIATGGLGIDLTRARITVMGELAWLPAEIAQAEARVFRSGQTQPCITYWPVFADTIEERIIEVLIAKADHARADIFPCGAAKAVEYDPAKEMVSLLDHAMEEEDE